MLPTLIMVLMPMNSNLQFCKPLKMVVRWAHVPRSFARFSFRFQRRETRIEHFGMAKASPRYAFLVFQQPFPLSDLSCCVRAFEFGDQLLELWVGVEILQTIVGHQCIDVFIPTVEGFT
jgi:hypothetical protein